MIRKVIKVGNSLAVVLPSSFAKKAGFNKDSEVALEQDTRSKMLLIKPVRTEKETYLSPEFFDWLSKIGKKYQTVIKELAKR